ncbi:GTPase-associated system all-helical protein GASH [Roseateles sp. 22389]|uniref:GTPase-associated system all-helical protein GASH n=1 Tax=Roseateles sp. 22389 TaxID=3453916 RepID=UPI003F84C319
MQEQFNGWYGGMEFAENAEVRAQRYAAIQAASRSPSMTTLEVLVRLAFRTKMQNLSTEAGQVRNQLAEAGPALMDEEAALLAAVTLAMILEEQDAKAGKAAALVTGAFCAGLRTLTQPMDLVGLAIATQNYLAETARRRPPLEQQKLVNPQLDIAVHLAALQDGNIATVRAAIEALASASRQTLTAMATRQRAFEAAVQGYVKVQDEELDILWWLQGGRCTRFDQTFEEVRSEFRPIVIAVELAALTKVLPGPTALPSLLSRAGVDDVVQLSIPAMVQGFPHEWLGRVLPEDKAGKVSATTTPILEAVRRRQEVNGQDTWVSAWATVTGVEATASLPARTLAELLYRELLQVSLG